MKTKDMQTITRNGKRYVLVPEADYRRLAANDQPELPAPDAQGYYPAMETMLAMLARDIIRDRQQLGLSQAELARRAGVRIETLCRIETGKHSPSVPTIAKIDRALKEAEGQAKGKRQAKRPAGKRK